MPIPHPFQHDTPDFRSPSLLDLPTAHSSSSTTSYHHINPGPGTKAKLKSQPVIRPPSADPPTTSPSTTPPPLTASIQMPIPHLFQHGTPDFRSSSLLDLGTAHSSFSAASCHLINPRPGTKAGLKSQLVTRPPSADPPTTRPSTTPPPLTSSIQMPIPHLFQPA